MGIIYFGIIIISISIFFSLIFKAPFYYTAPLSLLCIISFLFLGAIFIGLTVTITCVVIFPAGVLFYLLINKNKCKDIVDISTIFFIIMVVYFCAILNSRKLMLTDEFSYWGTAAKNMYYSDQLPNLQDTLGSYRDYIPGPAILQYFVLKLNGAYQEGILFQTISVFLITMLLPFWGIIEKVNRRNVKVFIAFLIILLPLIFNYAYTEIIIDPSLGVLYGYIMIMFVEINRGEILGDRDENHHKECGCIYKIAIVLACFVITILKASGMGFVLISCIILLIYQIREYKRNKYKHLVLIFGMIAVTFFAKGIWARYMVQAHININTTGALSLRNVLGDLKNGLSVEQVDKFKSIIKLFVYPQPGLNSCSLSYIGWIIVLVALAYLSVRLLRTDKSTGIKKLFVGLLFGAGLYLVYLIALYLFSWKWLPDNGSFYKYYNTYLLGYLIVQIYVLLTIVGDKKYGYQVMKWVAIIMFLFSRIYGLAEITLLAPVGNYMSRKNRQETVVATIPDVESDKEIYVLDANTTPNSGMIISYEFIPHRIIYQAFNEIDEITLSEMEKIMEERCALVYIHRIDEEYKEQFSSMFDNPDDLHEKTYYAIKRKEGKIVLERVDDET